MMAPDVVVFVDGDEMPYHNLETLKRLIKRVASRKLREMEETGKDLKIAT